MMGMFPVVEKAYSWYTRFTNSKLYFRSTWSNVQKAVYAH